MNKTNRRSKCAVCGGGLEFVFNTKEIMRKNATENKRKYKHKKG